MLKTFLKFLLIVLVFSFTHFSVLAASEPFYPIPGINCGIASKADINVCCSSPVDSWEITFNFPEKIKDLPVIGKVVASVEGMAEFVSNTLINEMPFPLVGHFTPLPTVGKIKDSLKEIPLCVEGNPVGDPIAGTCVCQTTESGSLYILKKNCKNISSSDEEDRCENCFDKGGVWTGLGCVQASLSTFIKETLLGWGIGLAGITALLCIIYSAFQLQTSQGNPEKIKKAQELLTSCIMGLMLIIFSIFILKLIGVNILKIPGFGG